MTIDRVRSTNERRRESLSSLPSSEEEEQKAKTTPLKR